MNEELFARLEVQLGRLLFAGVMSAAGCLAIGLLLWMAGGRPAAANVILTAGLVILMLTPIARVVTSLVVYVRMRDWFFVATTIAVFVVLLLAWLLKTG
jgi:Protein of unknown function (DUF1634)